MRISRWTHACIVQQLREHQYSMVRIIVPTPNCLTCRCVLSLSLSLSVCVRVCMSIHLCRYAWMDPVQHLVATSVLFAVGAAALRSAGCAINDIADREVRRASKRID